MATVDIRPQPKQEQFLSSPADIVIFGGAAGGGKTYSLLLDPLRFARVPAFGAVLFRRTHPQITLEGGLLDESATLYGPLGATLNRSALKWTFPSGATITLDAMQYESNVFDWQGAQIAMIGFDEVTHFTEKQFWYMLSRNRSTCGVKPYIRATCNPDPDSFVARLIEWWIDQDTGYPIHDRGGVVRWFYRIDDRLHWYATRSEAEAAHLAMSREAPPKSLTFVPSRLDDNAILTAKDPMYRANLLGMGEVDKERLLRGNWKVRPAAGKVFSRAWFEIVDAVPAGGTDCRCWDFAATEQKLGKPDPDFTAGGKIRKVNGVYYILDCIAVQENPAEVERLFLTVSVEDARRSAETGAAYRVRFEREPGSAAKRDALRMIRLVDGLDVADVEARGDKLTRARGFAAQARAGNVKLLRGSWNEMVLNHLHAIPDGNHDDIMDALAGAYNELSGEMHDRTATAAPRVARVKAMFGE